jgi:excisionase family DNA binding protein
MLVQLPTTPLCYAPNDAAKVLGIGRSTLFNLLARGELTARKLGTRTLITATELERYVASLPQAKFHAHLTARG